MKKYHLLFLVFAVVAFGSCNALRQMAAFVKCEFKIDSVKDTRLAGVRIQGLRSFSDLTTQDAITATTMLLSGRLPLDFTLNVMARNPNTQLAAMNRLDWEALIDQTSILTGAVNQRVEIQPNGGTAIIPLNVSVNLKQILGNLAKDQLLGFAFGMADSQDKPTRVSLRLKPTINVGSTPITYPGWFTVKRDFTSGSGV